MRDAPRPALSRTAVVDGVDVDAVAAAVRGCPAVEDLQAGRPEHTATYLPGRRVDGVRVDPQVVVVQVRARWGGDVFTLAAQVRRALAPLVAGRRVDVVVADLGPAETQPAALPTVEDAAWTTPTRTGAHSDARSSAPTIPTSAATPPPSSPV